MNEGFLRFPPRDPGRCIRVPTEGASLSSASEDAPGGIPNEKAWKFDRIVFTEKSIRRVTKNNKNPPKRLRGETKRKYGLSHESVEERDLVTREGLQTLFVF